jgi:two-component system KDP operon response regulator KdpE
MGELLARMRSALRRRTPDVGEPVVQTPAFRIDLSTTRITRPSPEGEEEVHLTPIEWGLVEQLVRNAGRLVSQRHLLHEVWGPQYDHETNYLRVHMANLRRKLEPDPSHPRYFVTEPGMGYRFEASGGEH